MEVECCTHEASERMKLALFDLKSKDVLTKKASVNSSFLILTIYYVKLN